MIPTTYKGYEYFKNENDGAWAVRYPDGTLYVVALNDTKNHGHRNIIGEANNARSCRDYIDWVTK